MLSLIGVGLGNEADITQRGINVARAADFVYIESYTAVLAEGSDKLMALIHPGGTDKQLIVADRGLVESGDILRPVFEQGKHVALLVVGDPFGATTHSDLVVRCHEHNKAGTKAEVQIVHNASIMNAVGCCGLQLYRFGQTVSLCYWSEDPYVADDDADASAAGPTAGVGKVSWRPSSWYDRIITNRLGGLHTLALLDIKVKEVSDANLARGRLDVFEPPRFMSAAEGARQILTIARERWAARAALQELLAAGTPDEETKAALQQQSFGAGVIDDNTLVIGLGRVGAKDQKLCLTTLKDMACHGDDGYLGLPLHCLVLAGEVHECEAEHVALYCRSDAELTHAIQRRQEAVQRQREAAAAKAADSDEEEDAWTLQQKRKQPAAPKDPAPPASTLTSNAVISARPSSDELLNLLRGKNAAAKEHIRAAYQHLASQ